MTITEFKYWLEGFEESFTDGHPSENQWRKIKERLNLAMTPKPVLRTPNLIGDKQPFIGDPNPFKAYL